MRSRRAASLLLLSAHLCAAPVAVFSADTAAAATGCDVTTGCKPDGGGSICGPFYMSEPYWQDANTSRPQDFVGYDFSSCATNVTCAGRAVQAYMHSYGRDCDDDGRVTCRDFGVIHYLGYDACRSQAAVQRGLRTNFYRVLNGCLTRTTGLLAREDYVPPPGHAPLV